MTLQKPEQYQRFLNHWVEDITQKESSNDPLDKVVNHSWHTRKIENWVCEAEYTRYEASTYLPNQNAVESYVDWLLEYASDLKEIIAVPTQRNIYFYGR